jgi:hypothetical protein
MSKNCNNMKKLKLTPLNNIDENNGCLIDSNNVITVKFDDNRKHNVQSLASGLPKIVETSNLDICDDIIVNPNIKYKIIELL